MFKKMKRYLEIFKLNKIAYWDDFKTDLFNYNNIHENEIWFFDDWSMAGKSVSKGDINS